MQLTPKSHKKFEKYRNTDILWPLMNLIQEKGDELMKTINVKAGDVLCIDDSIIHGTPINQSEKNRLVFHAMLIPKETHPIYCKKVGEEIKIYEVEDTFWQYFIPGTEPILNKLIQTVPYIKRIYTKESFLKELEL